MFDRRNPDLGVVKRLIEDVCSQNNLYQFLMDDGSLSDDLEKIFAEVVEPAFKEIVTKLINRERLTAKEKSEFATYISIQIVRTPATREIYNAISTAIMDTETKKQWAKLLNDDERERAYSEIKAETGVDVSSFTKEDIQGIIDGSKFTTTWNVPKENWIKHNLEFMGLVYRTLERMHWRVYFAPTNAAFITSDNPVGVLVPKSDGYYAGTGILSPGAIRLFPLSKNACLCILDDEPSGFSFVNVNKDRVKQVNGVTAISYHNVLIGHDQRLLKKAVARSKGFNMIEAVKNDHVKKLTQESANE